MTGNFKHQPQEKKCSRCKELKPADEFCANRSRCKECRSQASRSYYLKHIEELRQRAREYYHQHREERIAYNHQWLKQNRDKKRNRERLIRRLGVQALQRLREERNDT